MANNLEISTIVLNKFLHNLHNSLGFTRTINRQYDAQFKQHGVAGKGGETLYARKPPQFTVTNGSTLAVQDIVEEKVPITCTQRKHIGFTLTSEEITLKDSDGANDRRIKAAARRLAAQIDSDGLDLYKKIPNWVGTVGTTPASYLVYAQANAVLDNNCAPSDERYACINPDAHAATADALKALYHPGSNISDMYLKGKVFELANLKVVMDQLVKRYTTGTRTNTTPLVNEPSGTKLTEGTTEIDVDGFAAADATIKEGDIFTFANVFDVNPETKESTGVLKRFVATADQTASSYEISLKFSPAIYTATSGVKQNATALPVNDAAVLFFTANVSTAYPQNLVYHRDFATLVTADLEIPKNAEYAARDNLDGISVALVGDWDHTNYQFVWRADVYYGWSILQEQLACRLIG